MRRNNFAVAVLAVATLLTACSRKDARRAPIEKAEGEITVAYPDDPPSLNPFTYEGDSIATRDLLRPVFPTLLLVGPEQEYEGGIAIRVPTGKDLNRDPFTVTFQLDPRAVWSDGVPLTAEDVRFTWQTILNSNIPIANREPYGHITNVVDVGEHGVKLVFDGPYAAWPDLFSSGYFVMPKHALEGKDFPQAWTPSLPGAGPFVIENHEPGLQIVYAANPRWWGPGPGLERVTVQFVPAIDTALRLLGEGRVDVVVSTTQLNLTQRIERLERVKVRSRYGQAWWELAFHHRNPGPNFLGFRQAVVASFDRAAIVEALARDQGRSLKNLLPGRKVSTQNAFVGHSPEASRNYLLQAGFVRGRDGKFSRAGVPTIGISTPEENEMGLIVERAIFEGMRSVGVEVELRNPSSVLFNGKWRREGTFDIALWERRGSPSMALSPYFRRGAAPPAGLNYYRLDSPDVDAALDAAEHREAFRSEDLNHLMGLLGQTLPALPVFEAQAFLGFREEISGPDPNATIDGPFWNLQEWVLH